MASPVSADRTGLSEGRQRSPAGRPGADARNRTKSKVRSKVEHAFHVIKRLFGFVMVRYRGLDKNAHRLFVTCALANLFMARRHLLRQGA